MMTFIRILPPALACMILAACGGRVEHSSSETGGGHGGTTSDPGGGSSKAGASGGTTATDSGVQGCVAGGTTLATDIGSATALALDDAFVYFSPGASTLVRIPKAGGSQEVVASERASVIAADGTHVYWFNEATSKMHSRLKDGGPVVVVADKQQVPADIAVNDVALYWSRSDIPELLRWEKPGGQAASVYAPASLGQLRFALVEKTLVAADNADIVLLSEGNWAPTTLAALETDILDIAADGESVFVTTLGGDLISVSMSSAQPKKLASVLAQRLTIDATHVFTASKFEGIYRTTKLGDSFSLIVTEFGASTIALDDTRIYWLNGKTNELRCAPKGN